MLVLSRKVGESVVVGSNVVIKVMEISGTRVKIGVEAPEEINVHRSEVWVQMHPDQAHLVNNKR